MRYLAPAGCESFLFLFWRRRSCFFWFLAVPAGSQKLRKRQGVMNGGNQLKKKYCAWHEHLYFNTKRCIPTALRIQHVLHHILHLPHDKVFNLKVGHWNRKVSSTGRGRCRGSLILIFVFSRRCAVKCVAYMCPKRAVYGPTGAAQLNSTNPPSSTSLCPHQMLSMNSPSFGELAHPIEATHFIRDGNSAFSQ